MVTRHGVSFAIRLVAWLALFGSGIDAYALSPEQCAYFASGGKTAICHATTSAKNPFNRISVSSTDCASIHSDHLGDFVSINGATCNASTCLPEGAPFDSTGASPPCCEGLTAIDGVCAVNAPACLGGTFHVTVSGPGFMDETLWTLDGATQGTLATDGGYAFGSTNTSDTTTDDVPLEFNISTAQGGFGDNVANFTIECGGATVASGTSQGPQLGGPSDVTVSNICCAAP